MAPRVPASPGRRGPAGITARRSPGGAGLSWVYNLRRFQMSNDDYLPEDHEAAKAVFAEKGPLGLVASRGFSSQNSCSASRRDRKRVVSGKSVTVRVDLGGRRI